jgi:hypothetical protein
VKFEEARLRIVIQRSRGPIVEAVRTPIDRGHGYAEKAYYRDTHPNALLGSCYTEVIEHAALAGVRDRPRWPHERGTRDRLIAVDTGHCGPVLFSRRPVRTSSRSA